MLLKSAVKQTALAFCFTCKSDIGRVFFFHSEEHLTRQDLKNLPIFCAKSVSCVPRVFNNNDNNNNNNNNNNK